MKKIILFVFVLIGLATLSHAQTTDTKKETAKKTEKEVKHSTGTNKNGTPDMRTKENKEAKAAADKEKAEKEKAEKEAKAKADKEKAEKEKAEKEAHAKAQTQAKAATSAAKPAGADKVVGKDAKGRTLYEGPKGGKYYINSQGNK